MRKDEKALNERLHEIGKPIWDAMSKPLDIDFTRESPAITETADQLNEVVTLFCENKASKEEVRLAYKAFRDAHKGGLF